MISITGENYNGQVSLYSNAGKWCNNNYITFTNEYYVKSSSSVRFIALDNGSKIQISSGNWNGYGLIAGQSYTFEYAIYTGPATSTNSITRTITYIDNDILYLNSSIPNILGDITFPASPDTSTFVIKGSFAPQSIEFLFNLTQNGTIADESVIDSELNRFLVNGVNSMTVGSNLPMAQQGNRSGGYLRNVILTLVSVTGGSKFNYRINYDFWDWGVIQDGMQDNAEPSYYNQANHLAPCIHIKTYAIVGNPNGIFEERTSTVQANTGSFDENFNGGINAFSLASAQWRDSLGNPIDAMDFSNECTFSFVVNTPAQNTSISKFRIGLVWRPNDSTFYKNRPNPITNNLLVIAPDFDYSHSITPDPSIIAGFSSDDGARIDISDVQFEISGSTTIVSGKLTPNAAFKSKFADLADGDRRMTIWGQFSDPTKTGVLSNEVNLKLFDEPCIDAPTLGVEFTGIISTNVYDFTGADILVSPIASMITEDRIRFHIEFLLDKFIAYDGVRARIFAHDSSTGDEFTLEQRFFNFDQAVQNPTGIYNPNFIEDRQFRLPSGDDKNVISLLRNNANDTLTQYGISLDYSFLSRWEYWLSDTSVSDNFYDPTQPFSGKNKNWQRFQTGSWGLRFAISVSKNGIEDYFNYQIPTRTFNDLPVISYIRTFTRLVDMSTPSQLVSNELQEIKLQFISPFTFMNAFVEFKFEPFEGGPPVYVDSVIDFGSECSPFKPISGQTKVDVQFSGSVAIAKVLIDTNNIDVSKVSLSYRIKADLDSFFILHDSGIISYDDGSDSGELIWQ